MAHEVLKDEVLHSSNSERLTLELKRPAPGLMSTDASVGVASNEMLCGCLIQVLWRKIGTVGPYDGTEFLVDSK